MDTEWHKDWPRFFWHRDTPIVYEVLVRIPGEPDQIMEAYVDASHQYRADGLQWQPVDRHKIIPRWCVEGWRERAA